LNLIPLKNGCDFKAEKSFPSLIFPAPSRFFGLGSKSFEIKSLEILSNFSVKENYLFLTLSNVKYSF